jgi:hypothetical protein
MIHRPSLNREGGDGVSVCMDRWRRALPALLILATGCGAQAPIRTPDVAASDGPIAVATKAPLPDFAADEDRLLEHLQAFQAIADAHGGIRFAGTPGYEASVDHAAGVLRDLGFSVETPTVDFTGFAELSGTTLAVAGRRFSGPDELHALIYSPGGEVDGPVEVLSASGCDPEDFEGVERGALVLTTGGGCLRREQAMNAADAGAGALLVGYPGRGPGEIYRPTLIDPADISIPVVSVTAEAIGALRSAAGAPATLSVATERDPAAVRNVVAQFGDGPAVVMLGAHLDSVLEGPGLNDNASGVAALLEVARGVAASGLPEDAAVRIGLWGAEELGTVGSRAYVETMPDRPIAYINLDMAGSVRGANLVYSESTAVSGSEQITDAFEAWFAERGEPSARVDLGGSSDQFAFVEAGIPTGGLFAGASESGGAAQPSASAAGEALDPCYHLACDRLENVDVARVALFAEATYAVTLGLLGAR